MELEAINFDIPIGFYYVKNFISNYEQSELLKNIDSNIWENSNRNKIDSRLVQHYGRYYTGRVEEYKRLDIPNYMEEHIDDITDMCEQLYNKSPKFNQVSINNYNPGERRHKYVNPLVYNDMIAYISILSDSVIRFRRCHEKVDVKIEAGSLYITSSSSTYSWTYEVLPSENRRVCITIRELY